MKPLLPKDLPSFTQRFQNFEDAQLRSLEVLSASQMKLTLGVQDQSRAFDWITLSLEFSGVVDASLVADNQLEHIDMSEGAVLTHDDDYMFQINSATFFIKSDTLKYDEGSF